MTRPLAAVTGATAGIGAAFARQLARRGFDLLLVARNADRLRETAEALKRESGAEAEAFPADLAAPADLKRLEDRLAGEGRLELLVNNAGFGAGKSFLEVDPDAHEAMIRVHLTATVRLTRAALPGMVQRKKGAIVNVASVAGYLPRAGSVTYGASKGYLTFFSESLSAEIAGSGVRVQALCPGLTHTEFHQRAGMDVSAKPGWLWMSADDVAACSLRCLDRGRVVCVPGLKNRLFVAVARVLPHALLGAVVRKSDRSTQP